jgi:hypothetical protein
MRRPLGPDPIRWYARAVDGTAAMAKINAQRGAHGKCPVKPGGGPMRPVFPFLILPLLAACAAGGAQSGAKPAANVEDTIAAADLNTETLPVTGQPNINQSFTGSVPIFGRNIPLPPGSWTVIAARSNGAHEVGVTWSGIALMQRDAAGLRGVIEIGGAVHPLTNGRPTSFACASSDVLWNDIRQAVPHGPQDCALIIFERPNLWRQGNNGLDYQIINQLDALGIQPPNIFISAGIYEANTTSDLAFWLCLNPDLEGIAPDMSTQRAQSAWTAFNYAHDPAKLRFIDKVKAELEPLRAALRKQLEAPPPFVPGTGLTPA